MNFIKFEVYAVVAEMLVVIARITFETGKFLIVASRNLSLKIFILTKKIEAIYEELG